MRSTADGSDFPKRAAVPPTFCQHAPSRGMAPHARGWISVHVHPRLQARQTVIRIPLGAPLPLSPGAPETRGTRCGYGVPQSSSALMPSCSATSRR